MLAKECVLDVCISLVCQFSVLLLCLIYTHPSPPHTLMELVINMAGGGGGGLPFSNSVLCSNPDFSNNPASETKRKL